MTLRIKIFELIALVAGYMFHVSQNPVNIFNLGQGNSGYFVPTSVSSKSQADLSKVFQLMKKEMKTD